MNQTSDETLTGTLRIFESTHVSLNKEFLSIIPASINQSTFFVELADEMHLTFCEQIDNGCPVLLGLWDNVLKAEKKLTELLHVWRGESKSRPNPQMPNVARLIAVNCKKATQDSNQTGDSHSELESCVVDSAVILPVNSQSTDYRNSILDSATHLYVVSSAVNRLQPSVVTQCSSGDGKTAVQDSADRQHKEKLQQKNNETDPGIKEIYVDIAVNPIKRPYSRNKTSNRCLDLETSSEQHPLDKLCQLLCIDEEENIEKRLIESEKKRKYEEETPFKYFCDQCSFKTKRENHYLKHVKLHEKIKDLFCCDQCDFKAIRESVLCRHKMSHSPIQLGCKLCPYKTANKNFLARHVQVSHSPKVLKKTRCNYCDFIAVTPRDLSRHLKVMHKTDSSPKFWKCSKCPYKSKQHAHLSRHENDVHGSLRQFLCHYCGKSFKRNDTLTQHKITHGEVNKTYTCQQCGKICTSSVFFREHLATHTTERPFLCDVCGNSFKTRGATQRHKRIMHSADVPVYPCSQCDRTFKLRTDLNRHRKTHRLKTEATIVPAVISGSNVQEEPISTPITIQVMYTEQLDCINQEVVI